MANVEAPYGLRPINLIGGQVYAGSTRQIKIDSGYDTDIFFGDIVAVGADGTIEKVEASGEDGTTNAFPAGVVGVFMGCTYTEPTLKYKLNAQYWPADTVASDAMAYVCDDPDALFLVQADGSLDQDALGKNVAVIQGTGNTQTGNSDLAADAASLADDDFLPLRVVDFVDGPFSQVGDDYTDIIVKFNFGIHSYYNGTGVAGA